MEIRQMRTPIENWGSEFRFLRRTTFPPAELGIEIGHRVKKGIFMPVGGPGQDKKMK